MKKQKIITLSLSLLFFLMSFMIQGQTQDMMTVGEVTAHTGEKASGFIRVPGDDGGIDASIPVTLIRGQRPGPMLALLAGIHGSEYAPIIALQRLSQELDPAIMSGSVILVQTAHIQSFLRRTVYYNPVDGNNLNRMFPGDPEGTMTQRIAYAITTQVIDQCDFLIDNHAGDANEDLAPFIFCLETGDQKTDVAMRELAKVYGISIVKKGTVPKGTPPKYTTHTAALRGKPAITIESGKLGPVKEEDIVRVIKGSYNVMKHLGILEGEPEETHDLKWIKESTTVSSQYTGLFYPLVVSEEWVKKGQVLGRVTDFFGQVQQEVKAPQDGMVLYLVATPPINEGEDLVSVVSF